MTLPQAIARPLLAGMFIYAGRLSLDAPEGEVEAADKVVGSVSSATGLDSAQLVKANGAAPVAGGLALAIGVLPARLPASWRCRWCRPRWRDTGSGNRTTPNDVARPCSS